MGQQSMRQAARRAALDAQAQRRRERAERDKRIEALAVDVLTAIAERKAAVAQCDLRAGHALRQMFDDEGLSLAQVGEWCGVEVPRNELVRLRKLAEAERTAREESIREAQGNQPPT